VLKHGLNTAYGGNARERAWPAVSVLGTRRVPFVNDWRVNECSTHHSPRAIKELQFVKGFTSSFVPIRRYMIMRQRPRLFLLTSVAALAATGCQPVISAPAQNQQSHPQGQHKPAANAVCSVKVDENLFRVRLLMADAVQKDLRLTADQQVRIGESLKTSRQQSQEFAAKWPDFSVTNVAVRSSEARTVEYQTSLAELQRKQRELRARLVEMLTPKQSERLTQIQLRQRIGFALAEPELIKALDISETQLARLRVLCNRATEKRRTGFGNACRSPAKERPNKLLELSKKWDKDQAEANKWALAILTPEQRAKLESMLGNHVEMTWDYDRLMPLDGPSL
jgi:hypothetical protein